MLGQDKPAPAPAPAESPGPKLAPNFELPGTGGTSLRLDDARRGALAMFFYGDDGTEAGFRIVAACRDSLASFEALRAQLSLIGSSSIEEHDRLLERLQYKRALYHDKRSETQVELGLDTGLPGWVVLSPRGEIVAGEPFSGDDSESVHEAIAQALAALRSLLPADAPGFVTVLGEPFDSLIDLATLPDGRVVVLTPTALTFVLGETNEVVLVEGGGLHSLTVDASGLLYFSAGEELRMFHETEGIVTVMTPSEEDGGGTIECLAGHSSALMMFVRDGRVCALLPATGRVVPLVDEDRATDLVPTPDGSLLVLRRSKPYLRMLDQDRQLADLPHDEKLTAAPTAAVVDLAGRIFVTLQGQREVFVLDAGGHVQSSFPARGGGVDGTPLLLSVGAGYVDAAVRDDETKKVRILRFAL